MSLRNPPAPPSYTLPDGWIAQTSERGAASSQALAAGKLWVSGLRLNTAARITGIHFVSHTTAMVAGTHGWAALFDSNLALLGQSTDDTGITWAASTDKTFTLATPVTVAAGWYYIGVCVTATTYPTLVATAPSAGVQGMAPNLGGASNLSGLVGTAPNPATAITTSVVMYGGVS